MSGDDLARAEQAALSATLPEGYQWGHDAMEQFEFGKKRAAEAIRALAASRIPLPAGQDERVTDLVRAARDRARGLGGYSEEATTALCRELADVAEATAARLAALETLSKAAKTVSDLLDEFDGDYTVVDAQYWDHLWDAARRPGTGDGT